MACPCGFSPFKDLCYARTARASGGYSACAELCREFHPTAKVGCVRDAAADSFIVSTFPSYCGLNDGIVDGGDCLYFGFVQAPGSAEPSDGWDWDQSGACPDSESTYTSWESGQPNESEASADEGLTEQCAAYGWERSTRWYDLPCNQQYQCLCEAPQLSRDDPAACTDTVSTSTPIGSIVGGAVAVILVIAGVFLYLHKRNPGSQANAGHAARPHTIAQAAQVEIPVAHGVVVQGVPVTDAASTVAYGRAV